LYGWIEIGKETMRDLQFQSLLSLESALKKTAGIGGNGLNFFLCAEASFAVSIGYQLFLTGF
jgi:hypothetical protein